MDPSFQAWSSGSWQDGSISSTAHPALISHRAMGMQRELCRQQRKFSSKKILEALMCYRSTPCSNTGFSPAELLVRRKIRTSLPTLEKSLLPKWPSRTEVRRREKVKQAHYFNRHHGARPLPVFQPGDAVLSQLDHEKTQTKKNLKIQPM